MVKRDFGEIEAYQNMGAPIYPTAASLVFEGGKLGPVRLEECRWHLLGARTKVIYISVRTDGTGLADAQATYQQVCGFISDSLGEPIWSTASSDRLFRDTSFSDRERAFFADQAFQWIYWKRMLVNPAGHIGRDYRREKDPSIRMWGWSDSGATWAVGCGLSYELDERRSGGYDTTYRIRLELTPIPETDLRKIDPELAEREEEFSGWVWTGSDVWPNDRIALCRDVPDSAFRYRRENHLSLTGVSYGGGYVYTGSSPGLLQAMYASDTARDASAPNAEQNRGFYFFLRGTSVVFDTATTGYDRPIFYINTVSDIRYPEDPDCL